MASLMHRYDALWETFNSADLKRIAVLWGGSSKLRKEECIAYLRAALADPRQVDAALARMHPHERAALGLLKLLGGTVDLGALDIAVRTTGTVPAQARYIREYGESPVGRSLIERGIVMMETGYRYLSSSYGGSSVRVFTDDRILARIEPLEHEPLAVEVAEYPPTATFRRAQSVVLDIISIVRAVDEIGGIGLTKSGELRVNDLRKFARKMGWGDQTEFDGLAFPEPTRAYVSALAAAGLLSQTGGALVGAASLEQIAARPAAELLRSLVRGVLWLSEWTENEPSGGRYWFQRYGLQGRLAVLTALRCLPGRQAWYRFEDFERSLFARIGESYSVGGVRHRPYLYGKTPAEERAALNQWRQEVRESWEKADVPWLQAVFQTWLYAFGLVELSLIDGAVDRFRLTTSGRAVLWNESFEEEAQPPAEQSPAWVVQPNFDVVVYLGSASTEQIAFLEQHAERVQVAQHTAQYRLTRDSVYEGLQRGIGVDRLIEGLAAGSRAALPSNVVSEIRTWAALRERITIRRRADLIEFADATARQNALKQGLPGLAVGERFLLLPDSHGEANVAGVVPKVIDYAEKPAVGCLRVSEDGLVTSTTERQDLLTSGLLDLWAKCEGDTSWRLTRKSVGEAIPCGRTLAELLAFLRDRLTQGVPGILTVALRAWAGEPAAAGVAGAVVLQCPQADVLDALLMSQTLKPYLLGRIGPDAVLVNSAGVDRVRAVLDWAGIRVSAKIVPH